MEVLFFVLFSKAFYFCVFFFVCFYFIGGGSGISCWNREKKRQVCCFYLKKCCQKNEFVCSKTKHLDDLVQDGFISLGGDYFRKKLNMAKIVVPQMGNDNLIFLSLKRKENSSPPGNFVTPGASASLPLSKKITPVIRDFKPKSSIKKTITPII